MEKTSTNNSAADLKVDSQPRTSFDCIELTQWKADKKFIESLLKGKDALIKKYAHLRDEQEIFEYFHALHSLMLDAENRPDRSSLKKFFRSELIHKTRCLSINQLVEGLDAAPQCDYSRFSDVRKFINTWSIDFCSSLSKRNWQQSDLPEFYFHGNKELFDEVHFSPYAVARIVEYEIGELLERRHEFEQCISSPLHKLYQEEMRYFKTAQSIIRNPDGFNPETAQKFFEEHPEYSPAADKKNTPADTAASSKQNTSLNNHREDITPAVILQQMANLPEEILFLPRFLKTRHDNPKAPLGSAWQDPKNQKLYSELDGTRGFVASTENDDSLIFFDFDHVLDDAGNFIFPDAEKWFNYLHAQEFFAELSTSRTGIHMFAAPTKGKFPKGRRELDFGDGAKLEIFYGTNKFCLVTGIPFRCEPKAPIAQGEIADEMFQTILNEIQKRLPQKHQRKSTRPTTTTDADTTAYDSFRAKLMLDAINPVDLQYSDWLAVISSAKNIGIDYATVDAFNRRDLERHDEKKNQTFWDSLKDPSFDIETLHGIAKRFGYVERDARRQWYDLHPDKRPSSAKKVDIDEETKRELDDAIIFLESLSTDNFTADDAHNSQTIRYVALAQAHGFSSVAGNFFGTLKDAKKAAKIRLKESETTLTAKLAQEEINKLNAIIEINIKSLRDRVDREVTALDKDQERYRRAERQKREQEFRRQKREEQQIVLADIQNRLDQLRTETPSPERDAMLINLIKQSCEWRLNNRQEPVEVKAIAANADKIFTYDPTLDGLTGYDEFQQAYVFLKAPPWSKDTKFGDEWSDADDAQIRNYLRRTYTEFNNKNLVDDWLTEYARRRSFHEVKKFFKDLPQWDGKPRAETLFIKFLKAEDSPYVREVTMNWLTAAVARIFHPGCDYQLAPILLGEQGIGKSYLINKLGGKWYGSLVDDVSDPHAIDAIQKLWLVEVKEMASMKKDIDANKRFIDSAKDTRRLAYARRPTTIPRHCVFLITTNNRMCLADLTGNRRHPVIFCHAKPREYDPGLTDKYIAQLWAEVFHHYNELFKDGFDNSKLELSKAAQIQSDETAEQFTRDDVGEEIKSFLDTKIPPEIIWQQLTREERRKFFVEGNIKLVDGERDLNKRIRARCGRKAQKIINELYNVLHSSDNHIVEHEIKRNGEELTELWIYGSEDRTHICPAEIFHEAFAPTDRRISIPKILESLNRLDGWAQGKRIQKSDAAYIDQKIVFYRDNEV